MLHLPSAAIFSFIAFIILASPATPQTLQSQQTSVSSPEPGLPGVVATITSDNGTDLTSNFKTLFYLPDDDDVVAMPNITDRDLSTRTIYGPGVRLINTCRSLNAQFRMSMCDYHAERQTSMQRYLVQCSLPNRQYNALNPRLITEWGACNRDEICINSVHDLDNGLPTMASCVAQRRFEPLPNYDTQKGRSRLHEYLVNRMAMAVMSHMDGQTPMNVESLEMDAGIAGSSNVGGQVGLTSQKNCKDCFQLNTDRLAEGTDFLNTQAKVVAGMSAATAGILWIAAMSG